MAIEYMKENDIKDYNIHVLYTSLAKALVNEKRYDEALDVLHEAEKKSVEQAVSGKYKTRVFQRLSRYGRNGKGPQIPRPYNKHG